MQEQNSPPIFEIKSRDWWVKPVGMLVHNWALIEENLDSTVIVYFFHDLGITKGVIPQYRLKDLRGRSAIVDSLEFANKELATYSLRHNGFMELESNPGPWDGNVPTGVFYDARPSEEGIYSKAGYWEDL